MKDDNKQLLMGLLYLLIVNNAILISFACGFYFFGSNSNNDDIFNNNEDIRTVLFITPCVICLLNLVVYLFPFCLKNLGLLLFTILSFGIMFIFISLFIVTSYGLNHWIHTEWTKEIVEKRIDLEIEVCFLSFSKTKMNFTMKQIVEE